MALRPAVLLVAATVLALGSPVAMAANNGRGKPASGSRLKKKGAAQRTTPTRPVRRGSGAAPSLQGTRAAAAAQAPQRGGQPAARPQRRVVRGQGQEEQQQYRSPYHAARARQQSARRGGWRSVLIAGGIVAALGVGFIVGDALGLDNAIGNLFDNVGGGEPGPPDGWYTPPDGWPGDIDAPKPGEWPSWAPDKPGGGGGGPPSFEQVQEQLDKLMGRTPTPTK